MGTYSMGRMSKLRAAYSREDLSRKMISLEYTPVSLSGGLELEFPRTDAYP